MCTARGFEPLPPSLSQGGAVAIGAPQAAAFTGVGVVDAPVEALGEEAGRIGDAQHDHLAVLKGDEAVVEVGCGDRHVLTEAGRVVMVDPGVVARLAAAVLKTLERRPRILVIGEALLAVLAGRCRPAIPIFLSSMKLRKSLAQPVTPGCAAPE